MENDKAEAAHDAEAGIEITAEMVEAAAAVFISYEEAVPYLPELSSPKDCVVGIYPAMVLAKVPACRGA